ncbi:D-amino acid dehydrogenase [Mycobacterium innocens]|uniref:D-amino acid dehydrogenase n=1 Tax=Mycobacterium innocens TaxID=2341083 RepID=A0A498PXF8_9MYCO|nr:D-amino acid dehydrogenase [Mycobacterium innocens]
MAGVERIDGGPRSVVVVGAGIVGLSTAWFLLERGVDVTVVDRDGVGAGASGGDAGWIAPGLALPLTSPAVLRYGLRCLLDSKAPLHIPLTADLGLGVDAPVTDAPITAVFDSTAAARQFQEDLQGLVKAGQTTDITVLTGAALREQVPLASRTVRVGLSVNGQRFIDPARFVAALGRAVVNRGATLRTLEVAEIVNAANGIAVRLGRGAPLITEAAVIATGAQLPQLAGRRLGVPVRAGRGYSFTVPVERPMPWPIYLPSVRVAATPHQGAMRVSGTMEFRHPHTPVMPQRVAALVASAGPLLDGVRWAERSNVWMGARPIAADGRPVIVGCPRASSWPVDTACGDWRTDR